MGEGGRGEKVGREGKGREKKSWNETSVLYHEPVLHIINIKYNYIRLKH